ncbi:phosphate ABC transporter, inner membrane subunit PstA [Catenulispora acidiphila DSM 44928]|uniref:Phosphate transport system permease protein PstA n=1 Tax=Catenulispora acidiphila (strain DSM 44928 / JCM 14897 / NBRC 102108 / NRRL B-24433 / ID139908) TaxID=479433 RepID=C7QCM3_CATAD|nr:phosphate ABC transporter permease PstA [Catenulispora acidiphila]ACU76486.1 phosphate ABC transporter, inner membrane subunit PstA [Catenulispora acidiphila DSM 44928]
MTLIDIAAPAGGEAYLDDATGQVRVRPGALTAADAGTLAGAAAGALGLVWLVYERIMPWSGALGFWLCWYAAFIVFYWGIARTQWEARHVREKIAAALFTGAGILILVVLVDQVAYVAWRGEKAVGHGNFLTTDMQRTGPLDPLSSGGVLHAMIGSLEQLGLATLFAVPLGISAAVFMSEIGGRLAGPVRTVITAMTALPSIVAGLFILGSVILTLGYDRSGFAASLALTVMMMPIVTRASEVVIRIVPHTLREASYALGASQWRTVWNVVLPTARSGLTTAVLLGMARAVGETSPVLLTAGFTSAKNANPFSGQQVSLPLYVWSYVRYPQESMKIRAFGGALTLMAIVMILFIAARIVGGRRPGELTRRRRRQMARDRVRGAASPAAEPPRAVRPLPAAAAVVHPKPEPAS